MSTRRGYFLIADISGFTSFIAGSELEHSQLILNEILKQIVDRLTPSFTLAEIEGDAVFVYAPVEKFSRSEIILEMIESLYFEFRDTKATLRRMMSCNCKACEMVHSLDLKFIIHSGEYVLNEIVGRVKPMGNSINIVHRLLKNQVIEMTGWNAYILFTDDCMKDIGLNLLDYHSQIENYEHIGNIKTISINLDKKYQEFAADRRVFFSAEESDYFVERVYPVSRTVLWEWVNNPEKRSMWLEVSDWKPKERPFGRTEKGATNHCANSNFFEKLLDYRPFDYYTSEIKGKNLEFMLTGKFDKFTSGTKFIWSMKLNSKLPKLLKKYYAWFIWKKGLKIDRALDKLGEYLESDKSKAESV
jgi:hypothetical protein